MSDKHATLENRDGFQSKWGFILACIGSAVGMGNIWRFPIMVQQFGGMTFLIPYFLFVLLIGSTGIIEEFALGRWAQGGPVISFGKATEERTGNKRLGEAIGALPIVGSMMLAIGYTVVMSWIFKYCWMGISGSLYAMGTDMATIGGTFGGCGAARADGCHAGRNGAGRHRQALPGHGRSVPRHFVDAAASARCCAAEGAPRACNELRRDHCGAEAEAAPLHSANATERGGCAGTAPCAREHQGNDDGKARL